MRAFFPAATGAAALLAFASISNVTAQTYTYSYASATAAGVNGTITVKYADSADDTTNATITADLDFSSVKLDELMAAQASCTVLPTEYTWHIHVKWPTATDAPASAAYAAGCSKDVAGNHYDPLLACGTNSEYFGMTNCTSKTGTYTCNPDAYKADAKTCEKGDLSGKFGKLTVNKTTNKATGSWTDLNYPLRSENTAQWNIILHAVCGTDTPRVACAVGKYAATVDTITNSTDTTNSTTNSTGTTNSTSTTSAAGHSGVFNGVVMATSLLALLATLL